MDIDLENNEMGDSEVEVGGKQPSTGKRGRKPGRKSLKSDMKVKLERSRQSARECRARKKLRYQYLEDLASSREKAVLLLYKELEQYREWAHELDEGSIPEGLAKMVEEMEKNGGSLPTVDPLALQDLQ